MAGRNRLPAHPLKGGPRGMPPMREGPYARGPGPLPPHPGLVEEIRDGPFGRGPGPLPPHPALIEEKLAAQHQEIQGLLVENQRLAATHVALRQELASAQQELQHMNHMAANMHADKEHHLRELYDKSMKLEADLRANEPIKAELMQLRADNQKMGAIRQEMTAQVQALTQDFVRARADMQQVGAMRAEIESMHQELQRARTAIEYEKKARADQLEQGQAMEKNLISMAREVEKLRAELANADKRGRVAANPGGAYAGNYGGAEMGYSGGAYGDGYGVHPAQGGAESGGQYGAGAAPWGAYEMQRSHVRR
uniref:Protein FLX-like 1 n=1 Tax=Picea sitchensis TaxID=3332 RepID=C0PS34_PICSI|nr:unknown [Picea sitchensis]